MKCAGACGVTYEKTGVCFWLVADKYAEAEAAREIRCSTNNRASFDLLCVTSSNWKAGSSEMRKENVSKTIETQTKKKKTLWNQGQAGNCSNSYNLMSVGTNVQDMRSPRKVLLSFHGVGN